MASEQDLALAQYLTGQGIVTKADIDEAMADLEKRGSGRLSDFLLMSRKIDAQDLIAAQRSLKPGAPPSGRQPAAAPEAAAPDAAARGCVRRGRQRSRQRPRSPGGNAGSSARAAPGTPSTPKQS